MAATLTVGHKITIGSAAYSSAEHSRLTSLRIQSALDAPVNSARIAMSPPEGLDAAPDDDVAIELGYDDELQLVFTGKLYHVEYRAGELVMTACGSFRKLLAARFNLLYEKSTAGDIVSDLGSRLSVDMGQVDDGPEYPVLMLSDTDSVYDGLKRIAGQCGFDLYADTGDALVFTLYQATKAIEFQYGVNVLSVHVSNRNPLVTGVAIYGESPASLGQGDEAATWLAKKEILGQAGDSGGLVARRFDATARTQNAAADVASAVLASVTEKRVCTIKVLGAPDVQLAGTINISRMPLDSQNGTFKVMGVEHRLDARHGFVTAIRGLEV